MWKNIRKQYKSNKLKITAPTWNDEFLITKWFLFCVRYCIQDYIKYIIKKHGTLTTTPSIYQ